MKSLRDHRNFKYEKSWRKVVKEQLELEHTSNRGLQFIEMMKLNVQSLVLSFLSLCMLSSILLTRSAVQGFSIPGVRSQSIDACQYRCGTEVYKCDLRCKYWKDLRGVGLKACQSKCGDLFLDCFISCYNFSSF